MFGRSFTFDLINTTPEPHRLGKGFAQPVKKRFTVSAAALFVRLASSCEPSGMQADSHPALLYEALLPFLSKEDTCPVFSPI